MADDRLILLCVECNVGISEWQAYWRARKKMREGLDKLEKPWYS